MEGKKCPVCKAWKTFNDYFKDRTTADGYAYACKKCRLEQKRKSEKRKRDAKKGILPPPKSPILLDHNILNLKDIFKKPVPSEGFIIKTQIVDAIEPLNDGIRAFKLPSGETILDIRTKQGKLSKSLGTTSIRELAHFLQEHEIRIIRDE